MNDTTLFCRSRSPALTTTDPNAPVVGTLTAPSAAGAASGTAAGGDGEPGPGWVEGLDGGCEAPPPTGTGVGDAVGLADPQASGSNRNPRSRRARPGMAPLLGETARGASGRAETTTARRSGETSDVRAHVRRARPLRPPLGPAREKTTPGYGNDPACFKNIPFYEHGSTDKYDVKGPILKRVERRRACSPELRRGRVREPSQGSRES